MARRKIDDNDGLIIAKMLQYNKNLRKLELEGNLLGPQSASAFGHALKINKNLMVLNLESNQLNAENGSDPWGLYDFVEFLDSNTTLLSLNVANN